MAVPVISYTFSNGAASDASQVNQNFTDLVNALTDGTADLTVGSIVCNGALSVGGNLILGNAAADTLTIGATLVSSLLPTDATYNLGAAANQWKDLYLSGNAVIGGTLTLTGGLTLNGNVAIGNAVSDTLTVTATVTSDLLPTNATYKLGSTSQRWTQVFVSGNSDFTGSVAAGSLSTAGLMASATATTSGLATLNSLSVTTTAALVGNATFSALAIHPVGSAAAPSVCFTSDVTTGLYHSGASEISTAIAGTLRHTFTETSGGSRFILIGNSGTRSAIRQGYSDGSLAISSDTGFTAGAWIELFSQSHATLAKKISFNQDSTEVGSITGSGLWTIAGGMLLGGATTAVGNITVNRSDTAAYTVVGSLQNLNTGAVSNGTTLAFEAADTSANRVTGAYIAMVKDQTWTSTASTQDGQLRFHTILNGTVGGAGSEALILTSNKNAQLPNGYLTLYNAATSTTAAANTVNLQAKDDSGSSKATLDIQTEYVVEDIGTFTADKKMRVWVNGVEFHISLDAV